MSWTTFLTRTAASMLVAGALVACGEDTADILQPHASAGSLFDSYVALGNSLTAGYQSGGINDSTQRQAYPFLLAQQMGTRYNYASVPKPGCPPPAPAFGAPNPSACTFRAQPTTLGPLNNVAWPGAYAIDLTRNTTLNTNTVSTIVLGGSSQVSRALQADPTFVSIWVGNNEILAPASLGVLGKFPQPGPSATQAQGTVSSDTVIRGIRLAVDSLVHGARRLRGGILGATVRVANAPRFFPAESLLTNAVFKAKFDAAAGTPTTVFPNCVGSHALISIVLISFIRANPALANISCVKGQPAPALGEIGILDQAEQDSLNHLVDRVNAYVQAKADSVGWAFFDPNPTLAALKAAKKVPALPDFASAFTPFGAYVSLDGVHPRLPGHIAIANAMIDAINGKYGTSLAKITQTEQPLFAIGTR